MSEDILKKIVDKRRQDILRLGFSLGFDIPEKRTVGSLEFQGTPGPIFEVKRASPSKGDIALDLIPKDLAQSYANAGAQAISVLTESNYFKGTLNDLMEVAKAMDNGDGTKRCAVLRKDFLLYEEEIDIAYRAGADAVLLIARILDDAQLLKMAKRAQSFHMQAFVEVRETDDLRKLSMLLEKLDSKSAPASRTIVAGVNSRDLATFHIDPLVPAAVRRKLPERAVFESGVRTKEDAAFAKSLGFTGILVGEAVAKDPKLSKVLVEAFNKEKSNACGAFWKAFAEIAHEKKSDKNTPLVKICGNTRLEDVLLEAKLGADLIGFVFAESPRKVNPEIVKEARMALKDNAPLLIGVITDPESELGKTAIDFAQKGILDAIQFHGVTYKPKDNATYGFYNCFRVSSVFDVDSIPIEARTPRFLIDARSELAMGGSGEQIPKETVKRALELGPLWLAGGITPFNIESILDSFTVELIDLSSGVEDKPGIKSKDKLERLFKILEQRKHL